MVQINLGSGIHDFPYKIKEIPSPMSTEGRYSWYTDASKSLPYLCDIFLLLLDYLEFHFLTFRKTVQSYNTLEIKHCGLGYRNRDMEAF